MSNKLFCLAVGFLMFISGSAYAQKIKVASVGNSVTAGYLLPNPKLASYPAQLQKLLGNGYEVGNFGHSGATLLKKGHNPYFKTKEFTEVLKYRADVAIIHLGLNDTDPRNWPNYKSSFQADYQWLLDTLKKDNPKLKIFICKLSPIFSGHPRFKSGTRDWYWEIQDKIDLVAKANNLQLIDLHTPLYIHPELFADNLHPDSVGAAIIAKTVYKKISGDYGGFKLDAIFANNMVLQRDRTIPVYGTANTGELIEVTFNGITKSTVATAGGTWKANFPAMKFGGPFELNVIAKKAKITLKNILLGDVWLCSGQSNMAFPVKSSATGPSTIQNLNSSLPIRLMKYDVLAETDNQPWDAKTLTEINNLNYFSGTWETLTPTAVANFSAVGFYFAEKLGKEQNIPIGLIQLAVGGSTLESWMDRNTLEKDNLLVDMLSNWRKSDFLDSWVRGRIDVNLKNANNLKQRHPYEPTYNFDAGISKLTDFPIKGVLWYQGESNAQNVELFEHEFPLLIGSWREKWGYDFPFYYVQLSSIDRPTWPYFRDAQRKISSKIPNVAMAVSSDLGDSLNVHPTRKKEIGERLALLAEANSYLKNVNSSGPTPLKAVQIDSKVVVYFENAKKLLFNSGSKLIGFEVEDFKGNQIAVTAEIRKNQVWLSVPPNLKITKVLYAWQPFTRANLINEASLPTSTFSLTVN